MLRPSRIHGQTSQLAVTDPQRSFLDPKQFTIGFLRRFVVHVSYFSIFYDLRLLKFGDGYQLGMAERGPGVVMLACSGSKKTGPASYPLKV